MAGDHYRSSIQHWDYVVANNLDYFQGQITKYVTRWKGKNGLQDLEKARHFLDKYIEVERAKLASIEADVLSLEQLLSAGAAGPLAAPTPACEMALGASQSLSEPAGEISGSRVAGAARGPLGASQLFTPEGFKAVKDLWRCRRCKVWLELPEGSDPRDHHSCETRV